MAKGFSWIFEQGMHIWNGVISNIIAPGGKAHWLAERLMPQKDDSPYDNYGAVLTSLAPIDANGEPDENEVKKLLILNAFLRTNIRNRFGKQAERSFVKTIADMSGNGQAPQEREKSFARAQNALRPILNTQDTENQLLLAYGLMAVHAKQEDYKWFLAKAKEVGAQAAEGGLTALEITAQKIKELDETLGNTLVGKINRLLGGRRK